MTAPLTLGSYRLIAELGHGGMADVFLAAVEGPVGSGFSKLAVVKQLRSHLAEDPEFIQMLVDEARITARLSHPNVVQLFEMGKVDEQYFLAMEYLQGQPLDRLERRAGSARPDLPRELFYAVVSDMLAGLHHAHELTDYDGTPLEIVHRDVTPHNVFVTYDGVVKVVDFGIAKAVGRATETRQGIVKGKFRYMSPEQVKGHSVDRGTDIFAAGVILWQAATGTRLWGNQDDLAVRRLLAEGRYDASPRELCPEVPAEIDAICRKSLAFDRASRYATAGDMRADLEAFLETRPGDLRKELAVAVKGMFEKERTQVRRILEGAGLSRTASMKVFAASESFRAEKEVVDVASDEEMGPGARTELMSNAPPRVGIDVPSVAAVAKVSPRSMASAAAAPPRKPGGARTAAVVGCVALALASIGVALASRRDVAEAERESDSSSSVQAAAVASDPVALAVDHREKAGAPLANPPSDESAPRPSGARPFRPRTSDTAASSRIGAPSARVGAPSSAPSAKPPASASSKPAVPLDTADPWARGSR